jgi:hypothetical protein
VNRARARWLALNTGPGVVFLLAGVGFAIVGQWPAAIIALGGGIALVSQGLGSIFIYRSGFWRGRMSGLSHAHRISEAQNPWDAAPTWPTK